MKNWISVIVVVLATTSVYLWTDSIAAGFAAYWTLMFFDYHFRFSVPKEAE